MSGRRPRFTALCASSRDGGAVILMISSDMEEILNVSDRVAVMHEGEITGVLDRADCNEKRDAAGRRQENTRRQICAF